MSKVDNGTKSLRQFFFKELMEVLQKLCLGIKIAFNQKTAYLVLKYFIRPIIL